MKKSVVRRSVTIPKELDDQITIISDRYSYNVKNELYVELWIFVKWCFDVLFGKYVEMMFWKLEIM